MPELSAKAQANLRQLVLHEAKPYPKPLPATAVTRGFEKVAFPKIVSACVLRKDCGAPHGLGARPRAPWCQGS